MTEVASEPVHWFHVWVGDEHHGSAWYRPAQEHFKTLADAGFPGEVRIGLVGSVQERVGAIKLISGWCPQAQFAVLADEGFEQVTIDAMHQWAQTVDPAVPVYYSHSKGAFNALPENDKWRRAMDGELLGRWAFCVDQLAEYEAVGMHWLRAQEHPKFIDAAKPMFGGNFWWARAGYLAKLKPVEHGSRWHAEGWMGQGFPKVLDLKPGWPDYTRD